MFYRHPVAVEHTFELALMHPYGEPQAYSDYLAQSAHWHRVDRVSIHEDSRALLTGTDLPEDFQEKYREIRLRGAGGMSHVYEVENRALEVRRALKVLKPELLISQVQRQRFLQEARLLGGLQHRHLVQVYDAGQNGDQFYIEMVFSMGETCRRCSPRTGPSPGEPRSICSSPFSMPWLVFMPRTSGIAT